MESCQKLKQSAELCIELFCQYTVITKRVCMCLYNHFLKGYTENLMVVTFRNNGGGTLSFFFLYHSILFAFLFLLKCFEIQRHKCTV